MEITLAPGGSLAFKHNPDGHLGENLPRRPGSRMTATHPVVRTIPLALILVLAASGATTAPAAPAAPSRRTLPDSVLARTPLRDLTADGARTSWARLKPAYRPAGQGEALNRAFVEQLLEKEAMAQAALAEPFVMTAEESARYIAYRNQLEFQELYTMLVVDSAVVLPVDRDSARARMVTPPDGSAIPATAIESVAKDFAQRRRSDGLAANIKASLAVTYDEAVAEHLAGAYAAADSGLPNLNDPMRAAMRGRRPDLTAADSLRVLAGSTAGDLSVGEFVRRFSMLNPFQSPLPVTVGTVKARSEQFLGQMWFEAEVPRRHVGSRPAVQTALAERREGVALDHWYARHVKAAIDTSETAMRAHYAKDPARFGVAAHSLVHTFTVPTSAIADSLVAAVAAGTPWDSLCGRNALNPQERENCMQSIPVADDAADSALVARLALLAPGGAFVRDESPRGGQRVVQLVARNPARIRPFEEARTFVARDLAEQQAETLLTTQMAAARKALPVTLNDRAIARLTLEP